MKFKEMDIKYMLKKGVRSLANKDTNHNSYYSVSLPIVQTYNDYRWLPHNNLLDDIETLLLMKHVPRHVLGKKMIKKHKPI